MPSTSPDPYLRFERDEWSRLRAGTPLTLTEDDLARLRGVNEAVALDEVVDVFLPLSRLLNLRVAAAHDLHRVTGTFLGGLPPRVPFVVGVAGSVAVGKSTFARVLQALLARWPDHPRVALVPTDGFLLPNAVLEARGLMMRKGFPESYDRSRLLRFLADLKSGCPRVTAPVYSHLTYDIVPGEQQVVEQADVVIVEGLNVLQTPVGTSGGTVVSDFFDFSIYVDADEEHIRTWYVERFLSLRRTAFADRRSFFHHFSDLSEEEARQVATSIWETINAPNLRENILPTRERADLIVEKGPDHAVRALRLRRL